MINSRIEKKIFTAHSSTALSTTGSITLLSGIAQDDTLSGRTGVIIRPTSLNYRFFDDDGSTNAVRLILLQDYSANAAVAGVADVLSSAAFNSAYNPVSLSNKRFKILADIVCLTSVAGNQTQLKTGTIKLKGEMHFVGVGSTSASVAEGALIALMITQAGTPTVDLSTSLYYTDA